MAAYQCLNCQQIVCSLEDCCDKPDPFCINDMPGEIVRLRKALEQNAFDLDWWAPVEFLDDGNDD